MIDFTHLPQKNRLCLTSVDISFIPIVKAIQAKSVERRASSQSKDYSLLIAHRSGP